MDKARLKQRMLELEQAELDHAREKYLSFIADAKIDRSEPVESGDAAAAEAAGELAEAFDQPVHIHADKLAHLREVDFGPKTTVEEGAVVRFGGRSFVVCISTDRFEHDGETFMGISTAAPIYDAIKGLEAGDTATFNGREIEVEAVW